MIKNDYQFKHQQVLSREKVEEFLDRDFLKIVDEAKKGRVSNEVKKLKTRDISLYEMPVFSEHFCHIFNDEMNNFKSSGLPRDRPNSMNKHGVLVDQLGLDPLLDAIRTDYIQHIANIVFPNYIGNGLDSHKVFTVEYSAEVEGADTQLDTHFDNCEVT